MGEVVDIRANQPHMSGQAICLECRHEWVAVAEAGTWNLDCPGCHLPKGVWQGLTLPADGLVKRCYCSNITFVVTPEIILCTYCGQQQEFE